MIDISHWMGGDLAWGPTGDLAQVSDTSLGAGVFDTSRGERVFDTSRGERVFDTRLTTQRVYRRLLTNPADYIWNLTYGGGLARMVGMPTNVAAITGIIRSQMLQEASVASSPLPAVSVAAGQNGVVFAEVQYTDLITGTPQVLSVPVS